jgi:hypothetical protein
MEIGGVSISLYYLSISRSLLGLDLFNDPIAIVFPVDLI